MSIQLRAELIFPVAADPIVGGCVVIGDDRTIQYVGPRVNQGRVVDFEEAAILPGLVNAHTHLEFSDLTEPLGHEGMELTEWIPLVLGYRQRPDQPQASQRLALGIHESLAAGTTLIGDVATCSATTSELQSVRGVSFFELIGRDADRRATALDSGRANRAALQGCRKWGSALSPHAPYTTDDELVGDAIRLCRDWNAPLMMHVAESAAEAEWFREGHGALSDFLAGIGGPMADGPSWPSMPALLRRLSAAPRVLLVHGNYLDDASFDTIEQFSESTSIVFCPRTHAFFRHASDPLAAARQRGIRVALGTDGRCSNPDLSILSEMRFVGRRADVSGREALVMATRNGARALGQRGGEIRVGGRADLTVVPVSGATSADRYERLIDSDAPAMATIVSGALQHPMSGTWRESWPGR